MTTGAIATLAFTGGKEALLLNSLAVESPIHG
jgi:hypothetical protein